MAAVPGGIAAAPGNIAGQVPDGAAPALTIGNCRVLAGTTSWADRSLVRDGSFYPARTMTARERLGYYASRLPLTEVATTYRFPPTPEVARRWVDATPPGFTMDVQAWSLLSGAPTWPESLWPDLQGEVAPSRKEGAKLYRHRLPGPVLDECWLRFRHALAPLASSGRLGTVTVRYPRWFRPGTSAYEELAALSVRLEGFSVAVEVTNHRWGEGGNCEQLWSFLEQLGLGFVCRDGAGPRRPVAVTSPVALVRFCGRRTWDDGDGAAVTSGSEGDDLAAPGPPQASGGPYRPAGPDHREDTGLWAGAAREGVEQGPGPDDEGRAPTGLAGAAWWSYRYSREELAGWVPLLRDLASGCSELHLVMDNCWRSDAVDNARQLLDLLADARP